MKFSEQSSICNMIKLGYEMGACLTTTLENKKLPACLSTLKREEGQFFRVIKSMHLSRPEDYFSIYQSGCNHNCLKCHSWEFSKHFNGKWYSTDEIAEICKKYEQQVTVYEPRNRALMYTATDLCRHCGHCVLYGVRSLSCPNKLSSDKIVLSPQGFGPARNIVAFTGGDIACRAEFYGEVSKKIKKKCKNLWILLETNGFGLTTSNLDLLQSSGLDSFWLDIKAYDKKIYKKLCGTSNKTVLSSVEKIIDRKFVLEILTVYIPNLVEIDQFKKIARLIVDIDENIPFHILAFFPEYKLKNFRTPTIDEILNTYKEVKKIGLKRVKVGNVGVFIKNDNEYERFIDTVGIEAI